MEKIKCPVATRLMHAFLLAFVLSFCACGKIDLDPQEANVRKLYGSYNLSEVHWSGLSVDVDSDGIGRWDLLEDEFKPMFGYFSEDYRADVKGIVVGDGESAEPAVEFNAAIPYPYYVISDGKWFCSRIKKLKVSLNAETRHVSVFSSLGYVNPKINDPYDIFLSGIDAMCVTVSSFDDGSFELRLHCTLPHGLADEQELDGDYLSYTFKKSM